MSVDESRVGPRKKMMEKKIRVQVEKEFKELDDLQMESTRELIKSSFTTTYKNCFDKSDFVPSLVEHEPSIRICTRNSNYQDDAAISIYSHSLELIDDPASFPITSICSSNPFHRISNFSAGIVAYSYIFCYFNHVFSPPLDLTDPIAHHAETNERPQQRSNPKRISSQISASERES